MSRRMTRQVAARGTRRGWALLTSLFMVSILVVLSMALFALASSSIRMTARREESAEAMNLAMGGLDYAAVRLQEDPTYSGHGAVPLGTGTLELQIVTPTGNSNRRVVTATGTVTGRGWTVRKSVRTFLDRDILPPLFMRSIAARKTLVVNGSVDTYSDPAPNLGHVHSNADVELIGSAVTIRGNATAHGTVSQSGTPTVLGQTVSGAAKVPFPDVDQAFKDQALPNGTQTGNISVSDGSTVQGKISGNLTVDEPDGCVLNGVVWVSGSVNIRGPITGTGTIVCDGPMNIDARNTYATTDVSKLMFITTATGNAVDLGGNRQFKGIIYAPYGEVRLHGTPMLYGGIMADTVTISGTPDVTRYTGFDSNPSPFPPLFQVRGFQEL
jgi:hypothetical protein